MWIRYLGVHFAFGVDGIALVLIAMTTLLVPCVVLASWQRRGKGAEPAGPVAEASSGWCCCSRSS